MTSTLLPGLAPGFDQLARQEISRYARNKIYWFGVGLTAVATTISFVDPTEPASTTLDMIVPGMLLGVLGLVVMISLTRSSDRAAEAAGAVAVSETTRTLALAAAAIVPFVTGLAWYVAVVIAYGVHPPGAGAVPFGEVSDAYVLTVMFALGVMPTIGGPLLGLLLARWVPTRGLAVIAPVLLVLVTILMQGNFEGTRTWRLVWPWTYFYGPIGWSERDTASWTVLTGSPYAYVGYLVALCVLALLVALLRSVRQDPDADRKGLVQKIAVAGVVAVVLLVLAVVGGFGSELVNPVPQEG